MHARSGRVRGSAVAQAVCEQPDLAAGEELAAQIAMETGIVTPFTTFLVLHTAEQFVEHKIACAVDDPLYDAWQRLSVEHEAGQQQREATISKKRQDKLSSLKDMLVRYNSLSAAKSLAPQPPATTACAPHHPPQPPENLQEPPPANGGSQAGYRSMATATESANGGSQEASRSMATATSRSIATLSAKMTRRARIPRRQPRSRVSRCMSRASRCRSRASRCRSRASGAGAGRASGRREARQCDPEQPASKRICTRGAEATLPLPTLSERRGKTIRIPCKVDGMEAALRLSIRNSRAPDSWDRSRISIRARLHGLVCAAVAWHRSAWCPTSFSISRA